MKFIDAIFSGSIFVSGSFNPPMGTRQQRPTNPVTASVFFETSDSGSRLLIYHGSGSDGWQEVGLQSDPIPPPLSVDIEYLVVAGGGGGGGGGWGAGGGGAGGMLSSSLSSIESGSSITVTVGAGGTGRGGGNTFTAGGDGGDSSIASAAGTTFTTVTSTGGGGGGAESANSGLGRDGGSGGGSTVNNASGGSGTVGQGNDGGAGTGYSAPGYPGGGGGGKSSAGSTPSGNNGGDGGTGEQSSITGTATYYAGGGGGGTRTSGAQGTGGSSIGGDGANDATAATAATANRGGGGGGAAGNAAADGSNGGSGVVILAYDSGSFNAIGGQEGDAGNGRKYHKFNTSGTFYTGLTSDFQVITDGLEVFYNLANTSCYPGTGTTITDLSGNGHTGTFGGDPTFTNDYGGGVDLDGNGDYISVSNSSSGYAYSLDIWFYNDDDITTAVIDGPYQTLIELGGQYGYGSVNLGAWTGAATNETIMFYTNASSAVTYIRDTVSSGIHNIAVNWNGSQYDIWIDGVKKTTYATANGHSTLQQLSSSSSMRLGGETGGYTYDFDGRILNFLLYTSTLTDSQVTQNYNALRKRFGL